MKRSLFAAVAAFTVPAAVPTHASDGMELFGTHCAICHQASGTGYPPAIPPLNGSQNLDDPYTLVSFVHSGGAYMPPFPTLDAADITAIADYVRGAWSNSLPPVSQDEVAGIMAEVAYPDVPELRTIWDGVYTRAQAEQGMQVTRGACGLCHGTRLNGAPDDNDMVPGPPLARAYFIREWNGRTLGSVFSYSRATMPKANPGFLSDEEYAAIIAYMLQASGAPAGQTELPADPQALGYIMIEPQP